MQTGAERTGRVILALPGDLMFASRIQGAARAMGANVVVCARPAALYAELGRTPPERVLIDLDARGWDAVAVIAALIADHGVTGAQIIAFVSHVRADAIAAARAAGAGRVLARSSFLRELPALLGPAADGAAGAQ